MFPSPNSKIFSIQMKPLSCLEGQHRGGGPAHQNLIPTVKSGASASCLWTECHHGRKNELARFLFLFVKDIFRERLRPSFRQLKLDRGWVIQQDSDPKHRSKLTTEWLHPKKMRRVESPGQSPDLNPLEMLWRDLKRAIHMRCPRNIAELKQFCNEDRSS